MRNKRENALLKVIKAISLRSAKFVTYTTALFAMAGFYPQNNLPPILITLGATVGIESIGNLLDKVMNDDTISDDYIIDQVELIINASQIANKSNLVDIKDALKNINTKNNELLYDIDNVASLVARIENIVLGTSSHILLEISAEMFSAEICAYADEALYEKLTSTQLKVAYKSCLAKTIEQFVTLDVLPLAKPIVSTDGVFANEEVVKEIAQLFSEREVDAEKISLLWQSKLNYIPPFFDFNRSTKTLLLLLAEHLGKNSVFMAAIANKDIKYINISKTYTESTLVEIVQKLDNLSAMFNSNMQRFTEALMRAPSEIRSAFIDQSIYIEEKSRGFIGRKWIFERISDFLNSNDKGYFYIVGDPGIGKTALVTELVKREGWSHHFNIRMEGQTKRDSFIKNICAQLIAQYNLEYTRFPMNTDSDNSLLISLLKQISEKTGNNEKCVIIVDALDEAEEVKPGQNRLGLPVTLPPNVYFIITLRDLDKYKPHVYCPEDDVKIKHDSLNNINDIKDFLASKFGNSLLMEKIIDSNIGLQNFIELITEKSEGNFMYLYYVLPEIERGAFQQTFSNLPKGLKSYYNYHWQLIKNNDEISWFAYKLPVLLALAVAYEPISVERISAFSEVTERSKIMSVLKEWYQFLHIDYVEIESQKYSLYRLYHASFFEYIKSREEINAERVDLIKTRKKMAKIMYSEVFDE